MKEVEALEKIKGMSIDEKIAALSPTDKAYITGYIERAVMENRKHERRGMEKKSTEKEE
ncbi:MAG: hypothetical protein LBQ82_08285 [Treponema sp.]|jgi:hypothetical protein|nr:hypothetical protein [Treponema sp.]